MKRLPRAVLLLISVSVILASPFIGMGVGDVLEERARPEVILLLLGLAFILSLRPIRVQPNTELSPSDVAVLIGIVFLTPGSVALVAAVARILTDLVTRKRPIQIVRNATAVAIATGTAAMVYRLTLGQTAGLADDAASTILAGVLAVVVLVGLDIAQIFLLQLALRNIGFDRSAWSWIGRTIRAQFLWSLAAVISIQVVLIEPWFLVPGVPLFVMGYLDIRARFAAERRARLLAVLSRSATRSGCPSTR